MILCDVFDLPVIWGVSVSMKNGPRLDVYDIHTKRQRYHSDNYSKLSLMWREIIEKRTIAGRRRQPRPSDVGEFNDRAELLLDKLHVVHLKGSAGEQVEAILDRVFGDVYPPLVIHFRSVYFESPTDAMLFKLSA